MPTSPVERGSALSFLYRRALHRFVRREDGALTFFTVALLLMMLMVCGVAVDLMHNEMVRTRVQNTLDRAILAASDLDQPRPPQDVVEDYFEKAGMADYLEAVAITPGANEATTNRRVVQAIARTRTNTPYMAMTGVDSLPVIAAGTAAEIIENNEISLVLDISGSMRNNGKIGNMRRAAKEFVATVLEGTASQTTSVNIIPYAGQVNPNSFMFARAGGVRFDTFFKDENGDDVLYGYFETDPEGNSIPVPYNTLAHCLELQAEDFDNINLPSGGYAQTPYFMNWTIAAAVMDWGWCPQDQSAIQYAQNDITALQLFIDNMRMHDGTGTHYGMKYGVAALNPSSQDDFDAMSDVGLVPTQFADRPAAFDADDTYKYIVLMTDGRITDQFRPTDTIDPVDGLRHADDALLDRDDTDDARSTSSNRNTNRDRFYAMCDKARAEGIVVYTIAFEAPESAQTEMRNCADDDANFFNVQGVEISEAFQAIARQIVALRLLQ